MKTFVPWPYQKPICETMINNNIHGCFAFPGAGKTAIALNTIYSFKKPCLVVAPLPILYTTWLTEYSKWKQFNNLKIAVLHTDKELGFDKNKELDKKAGVYLINPEGIVWLLSKLKARGSIPWHAIFIDESVKFKNHKTKRYKAMLKIIKAFKRRYLLCGNPIPNHYLDIWAQIFLLDFGERLGPSFHRFKNRYFYPTDYRRFNWELKPGAQEEIIRSISDICTFVKLNDTRLKIPKRLEIDKKIILPPNIQKIYNSMEKKLFAELDDPYIIEEMEEDKALASTKTSALMKCWQIAQGFVYTTKTEFRNEKEVKIRFTQFYHQLNIELAKEIVEEMSGEPIIIAYHFNEDLKRLEKAFPDAAVAGTSTSNKELQQIETDWNKGKIEVVLAYISKLSHGLNLQYGSGKTILLYSLLYNYDTYDQLIRRFQRQGAKFERVLIIRMIVENTIHEAMLKTLERKESQSNGFLNALYEYKEKKVI